MLRRLARRLLGRSKRSPTASAPKQAPVQAAPPTPAAPTETTSDAASELPPRTDHVLALYKYDACPYCRRVQRVLDTLDLHVEMRDTMSCGAHSSQRPETHAHIRFRRSEVQRMTETQPTSLARRSQLQTV